MVFSQSERAERCRKIADYAVTHDTIETAVHFRISQGMVRNACKEFGIVPRTAVKSIGCRTLDVLKHLLDGKSQTQIAEEIKISRQRVHAVAVAAKAAGIQLPESSG